MFLKILQSTQNTLKYFIIIIIELTYLTTLINNDNTAYY